MSEDQRATNYFSLVDVSIKDKDYQLLPSRKQEMVRMYADESKSKDGVWMCRVPVYAVDEWCWYIGIYSWPVGIKKRHPGSRLPNKLQ